MKIILTTAAVAMMAFPSMVQAQTGGTTEVSVALVEVACSRSVIRASGNDACGAPVTRTVVGSARGFGRGGRSR